MNPAATLLEEMTRRGIEMRVEGDRLRFRPAMAMTPDLAERVKRHKADLLALLAEPAVRPVETHADREIRRFLRAAVKRPDGRGWYDPGSLRDAAGRAYLAHTMEGRWTEADALATRQVLRYRIQYGGSGGHHPEGDQIERGNPLSDRQGHRHLPGPSIKGDER